MKKIIGFKEFRNNADVVIKHVNNGHSFVVFKRSKPIFEISPVGNDIWEEVIDFTKIKKGGVNIKDILKRL